MDLTSFVEQLQIGLESGLPGIEAHKQMMPFGRLLSSPESKNTKESSVLILVSFNYENPAVTFIERAKYNGYHSGQIAFPGGKFDPLFDKTPVDTAIRETMEEIGYATEKWQIIAQLSDLYIPVSDILVYPFVAVAPLLPNLQPTSPEVAKVMNIPLTDFSPENVMKGTFSGQGFDIEAPFWYAGGKTIWGATAMIMSELIAILNK